MLRNVYCVRFPLPFAMCVVCAMSRLVRCMVLCLASCMCCELCFAYVCACAGHVLFSYAVVLLCVVCWVLCVVCCVLWCVFISSICVCLLSILHCFAFILLRCCSIEFSLFCVSCVLHLECGAESCLLLGVMRALLCSSSVLYFVLCWSVSSALFFTCSCAGFRHRFCVMCLVC